MSVPCVLSVAGSDPTGGAGIESDLRVFQAMGVHGAAVATALTTQTPNAVLGVSEVPPQDLRARLGAVLSSLNIAVVRVGMLPTLEGAKSLVASLEEVSFGGWIVVDPVMFSTSGYVLADVKTVRWLVSQLGSRRVLLTPNHFEATALAESDLSDADRLAPELSRQFGANVLVTGGDLEGGLSRDILAKVEEASIHVFESTRFSGPSPHGTGCAFAAAISAGLARGCELSDAVQVAKDFVTRAIEQAFQADPEAPGGRFLLRFSNEIV